MSNYSFCCVNAMISSLTTSLKDVWRYFLSLMRQRRKLPPKTKRTPKHLLNINKQIFLNLLRLWKRDFSIKRKTGFKKKKMVKASPSSSKKNTDVKVHLAVNFSKSFTFWLQKWIVSIKRWDGEERTDHQCYFERFLILTYNIFKEPKTGFVFVCL